MGISTIQSYQGAQIFEAIGVSPQVIDKYFTNTVSRVGGITLEDIASDVDVLHSTAWGAIRAGQGRRNTFTTHGRSICYRRRRGPETMKFLKNIPMP